jgi:riboflavin synthase
MFTGLIEEIGTMKRIARKGQAMVLTIGAKRVLEDVRMGDSISVNGVCLTVIAFDGSTVSMDVMPETFRHTNLKLLQTGDRINLERAMSAQGRFGGHVVQGHVDATGTVLTRTTEENAVVFSIEPHDPSIMKYIVTRGSITVDGISLTVVQAADRTFTISIIPHTLAETVLHDKQPGAIVNVECDLFGKYVERLLTFQTIGQEAKPTGSKGSLTEAFLSEHGFR